MEWPKPSVFDANNTAPWVSNSWGELKPSEPIIKPDFADNEELKRAYGVALGQGLDAFNAAMEVFSQELPKALWASLNWIKDPIVIGARDAYLKTLKAVQKPLDKEELLAEVLETARIADEFKDKAALLKLYSDIAGFTGKIAIDASTTTNNNTQNNTTQIVLVKGAEDKPSFKPVASPDTNIKSKISNNGLPQLKLVGGSV